MDTTSGDNPHWLKPDISERTFNTRPYAGIEEVNKFFKLSLAMDNWMWYRLSHEKGSSALKLRGRAWDEGQGWLSEDGDPLAVPWRMSEKTGKIEHPRPGLQLSSCKDTTEQGPIWSRLLWLRMRSLKPQRGKEDAPMATQLISSRTGICPKILCFTPPPGDPSALGLLQKGQRLHVVEVPDGFEKVLPVVWELDLSRACAGLELSQERGSFQDGAAWFTPRKLRPPATAPTLALIINSRFTGLECTGSGEQPGSPGSQERDDSGGEGGKV